MNLVQSEGGFWGDRDGRSQRIEHSTLTNTSRMMAVLAARVAEQPQLRQRPVSQIDVTIQTVQGFNRHDLIPITY